MKEKECEKECFSGQTEMVTLRNKLTLSEPNNGGEPRACGESWVFYEEEQEEEEDVLTP